MKILYLYQHFVLPEKNGITRTYEFARRLCNMGHEVDLIVSDESLDRSKKNTYTTQHSGIHIHWLPIPYHNRMSFVKRIAAFSRYVLGAIQLGCRLKFDCVYVSSPPLTVTLAGIFLSKLKKVPMVLEVRDLWPDLPIIFKALKSPLTQKTAKAIELYAYRSSAHLIVVSPGIKRAVIARGVPKEHVTLIPNSCDIESFQNNLNDRLQLPKGIKPEDHLVLYPGTLGVANEVSYIVELANELKHTHPEIKFLLVGDGKEKEKIINLATQFGVLEWNLFFMDPVSKNDIPAIFKRSSIVLNTLLNHRALWNSSPNKFFDALASARPVAINFEGWLAELIRKYDVGLVLDSENIKTAASQITQFLSDPSRLDRIRKNSLQLGIKEFDRNVLSLRLHKALSHVIELKPPSRRSLGRDFVMRLPFRSYFHHLRFDKLIYRYDNPPY